MKLPWMQFHTRDWLDNKELRRCTPLSRALLADLMCLAHEGEPYGYLSDKMGPLTSEYMAARCFLPIKLFIKSLAELMNHGRVESDGQRYFVARMVKDGEIRAVRAKGGYKSKGNPKLTSAYNCAGFVYLARRSSDGAVKIGIALNPTNRMYKLRAAMKGDDTITLLCSHPVSDMGKTESELHAQFADKQVIGEWFSLKGEDISTIEFTLKGKSKVNPVFTLKGKGVLPSDSDSDSSSEKNLEDIAEKLFARHPLGKRKDRILAEQALVAAVVGGADTELIDRVHRAMCETESWGWKEGAKAPTLAQWLDDKGWKYPPDSLAIVSHSGYERYVPPKKPENMATDADWQ